MKVEIGLGTITLLLIILKLANVIQISWWWVFAPLWIPLVILLVLMLVVGVVAFVIKVISD